MGFGIDGATPAVWRATKKPQKRDDCVNAIAIAKERYGLIPEALMVFGHRGHDTVASLRESVEFCRWLLDQYGAVPRPHVAKDVVPGNDGWFDPKNKGKVDYLIHNPRAFQMLDFTCTPSWLTHEEPGFRSEVTSAYLDVCRLNGSLTRYVEPEDLELSGDDYIAVKQRNQGKYDT